MMIPVRATSKEARRTRSVARAALLAAALTGCTAQKGVDDPANELPFGRVDIPAPGAQVNAMTAIAGWALDDRGVRQIRVYVDGHIVNTGGLTDDRPDVSQAFPQYARGANRHGYRLLAGFDAPGPHTIVVQAIDSDGATRDIGVVSVTALDK